MTTVANRVNVQALLEAREALKGAPEAAQFTWRASAKWQGGVHSTVKVQSFFGLGRSRGQLRHDGGVVDSPGLYALGLPVLRRRKSTFIYGIEDDACDVIGRLTRYLAVSRRS